MNHIAMTRARRPRWRLAAGALLSVALLGACEGENLFNPAENPFTELHVALSGASGGLAGDTLRFTVSGDAPNNLSRFDVSVRGAVAKDTSITASGRQAVGTIKIVLPQLLADTMLYVSARAVDQVGNTSRMVSDTFVVYSPPAIVSLSGGEALQPGTSATLRLRAVGIRPIAQMTLALSGAATNHQTADVLPSSTDASRDFIINIPSSPTDTMLQVSVTARDVGGLTSARVFTLPIQVTPPSFTQLSAAPGFASPGSDLHVTVGGTAMRGVKTVKARVWGSGYDVELVKTFTAGNLNVTHTFPFPLPGNLAAQVLNVEAEVIDQGGATASWTLQPAVPVATGDPVVDSVRVPVSVQTGGTLDTWVYARGPRPIKSVTVWIRGGADNGPGSPTAVIASPTTSIVKPVAVQVTALPTAALTCSLVSCSTVATVTIFVTDVADRPSAEITRTIQITGIPLPPEEEEDEDP